MARLLPPESAALEVVAREVGVGAGTLERWREDAQSRPARGRAWTAGARLEAVITTAAMNEAAKSAWCRERGVFPADLVNWRASCATALADPEHEAEGFAAGTLNLWLSGQPGIGRSIVGALAGAILAAIMVALRRRWPRGNTRRVISRSG